MSPEQLRDLIAGGESLDVEFNGEEARPGRSLVRRGEGRGAYYVAAQEKRAVARSNGRPPVSAAEPPDSVPSKARGGGRKKPGGERRP